MHHEKTPGPICNERGIAVPELTRHLGQKDLARRWGVSIRTVERWRRLGLGPPFLKLNGRVVYRLADVEQFEADRIQTRTACSSGAGS